MFERKITLDEQHLYIRKKQIPWSAIVGMRIAGNNNFAPKIDRTFPFVELFLMDGRVYRLSGKDIFLRRVEGENTVKISPGEAVSMIQKYATNTNLTLNNWLEWRLVLPIMILELFPLVIGVASRWPIEQTVKSGLIAGMVGGIIGFVWERKARKKVLRTI
ncbi:hypothetical protein LJC22_06620 [Desulfosarcina sp. OttesenSCG-928-G10]|nr:hypothetical protein [Desulfosarcina sp. OttesenSCG-928-G10]